MMREVPGRSVFFSSVEILLMNLSGGGHTFSPRFARGSTKPVFLISVGEEKPHKTHIIKDIYCAVG
ncbi:MAG: hypothetical protein PHQ81_06170, partial [Methanofollis sp.]|nr:hypothetical protein [Methanofollis sp.]